MILYSEFLLILITTWPFTFILGESQKPIWLNFSFIAIVTTGIVLIFLIAVTLAITSSVRRYQEEGKATRI